MKTETQHTRQHLADLEAGRKKAFKHRLRHEIFLILFERPACISELAEDLRADRRKVGYHVRFLAGTLKDRQTHPLIELVDTDARRGGTQLIYRAIERPVVTMEMAADHSLEQRRAIIDDIAPRMARDLQRALETGSIYAHPQWSLWRTHDRVDEEGMLELARLGERVQPEVEAIFGNSANRMADTGEGGMAVASHLSFFPIPGVYERFDK